MNRCTHDLLYFKYYSVAYHVAGRHQQWSSEAPVPFGVMYSDVRVLIISAQKESFINFILIVCTYVKLRDSTPHGLHNNVSHKKRTILVQEMSHDICHTYYVC